MNKSEFLRILRENLNLSLEKDAINEQLDYYDKYISDEIKKGRTEREVLDELGDPRLIAKTIKTVNGSQSIENDNQTNTRQDDYSNKRREDYGKNVYANYMGSNGVIGCTIAFLVIFIIAYSLLRLFGNALYGLGVFALSGPIGFIIVMAILFFLFGNGRK